MQTLTSSSLTLPLHHREHCSKPLPSLFCNVPLPTDREKFSWSSEQMWTASNTMLLHLCGCFSVQASHTCKAGSNLPTFEKHSRITDHFSAIDFPIKFCHAAHIKITQCDRISRSVSHTHSIKVSHNLNHNQVTSPFPLACLLKLCWKLLVLLSFSFTLGPVLPSHF